MRIVKIGQSGAKLGAFENREKLPKMIELRGFGENNTNIFLSSGSRFS